jgi:hypothetical protein
MPSSKMIIATVAIAVLAGPGAAHGDALVPDREADIMQMQLQSAATQPPPPPMSGVEADLIYRAYLSRLEKDKPAVPPPSASSSSSSSYGTSSPSPGQSMQ